MTRLNELIHGYLDETLTPEELSELSAVVQSNPEARQAFVAWMMLHDRLGNELRVDDAVTDVLQAIAPPQPRSRWSRWMLITTACGLVIAATALWPMLGESTASASVVVLNRLIEVSGRPVDREYVIHVSGRNESRRPSPEDSPESQRPPKPPLEGAQLFVRPEGRFVLVCQGAGGEKFITGSDGRSSWSVSPSGAARVSDDVTEFSRDVPGHEHQFPLGNIHQGLEHLRDAYDLHLIPAGPGSEAGQSSSALLVAVKRQGGRGPERVEIAYEVDSGEIQSLQFVGMPYGPDWLNVRVQFVGARQLAAEFFQYGFHNDPRRPVRKE